MITTTVQEVPIPLTEDEYFYLSERFEPLTAAELEQGVIPKFLVTPKPCDGLCAMRWRQSFPKRNAALQSFCSLGAAVSRKPRGSVSFRASGSIRCPKRQNANCRQVFAIRSCWISAF